MTANDQTPVPRAWIVEKTGPSKGSRHLLKMPVFRIGSDPHNDLVVEPSEPFHLEVRREDQGWTLVDMQEQSQTLVNGKPAEAGELDHQSLITLGSGGPRLVFQLEGHETEAFPNRRISKRHEAMIDQAVSKARALRSDSELSGQTTMIMRDLLLTAVHRSKKKHRAVIAVLIVLLLSVIIWAALAVKRLKTRKTNLDARIVQIEAALLETEDLDVKRTLIAELERYQQQAEKIRANVLYELSADKDEAFIESEIRSLLTDLGAEEYSIPPQFVERVDTYIQQFKTRDRANVERILFEREKEMLQIRDVFERNKLPPDLAYMILVESAFLTRSRSRRGAAGIWQFVPRTARHYGLKVTPEVDERFDVEKSTQAAVKYLRDLILEFGSGSSVMLALAAYNAGPTRVRRAVRKVKDPIRERNFWFLYRIEALPAETREYVPKIFAGIIISRNPTKFGFLRDETS